MKPSSIQESVGEVVRKRRTALGLSQEEFAAKIGLHRTYVGGFERGERNLTLANLSVVANGLGIKLSSLIAEAESRAHGVGVLTGETIPNYDFTSITESRRALLAEMSLALSRDVTAEVQADSDICSPTFAQDFQDRLVLYHAMNAEVLTKKAFEYAFVHAMVAAGRKASLTENQVNAGTDAIVDGTAYSLKTEASAGIVRDRITISKLMEARWIRDCSTGADFATGLRERIVPHLRQYQRIVMLRAFRCGEPATAYEYSLVEIPLDVLLAMDALEPTSFSPRTPNGSSRAEIVAPGGRLFSLRLDGSVEKVTIANLLVTACRQHASWKIPMMI